jgi:hypothetical protein
MSVSTRVSSSVLLFLAGLFIGSLFTVRRDYLAFAPSAQAQAPATPTSPEEDIAHLKEVVPSQSHSMMDVGFHFQNLWFAADKKNWPLAEFYLNETRSHIRWTVRIRPVRRGANGNPVNLAPLFEAMEKGPLTKMRETINQKDSTQFVAAYKETAEACYLCHKASDKPFLRPMIPTAPAQGIINFDPNADWPK